MKELLKVLGCVAIVVALALSAVAAEDEDEDLVALMGTVKVTKDGDKVAKIELIVKELDEEGNDVDKAYAIAQNDKSAEVAKLDGKLVTVKGTLADVDGTITITVKEVKEVKPEADEDME